MKTQQLRIIGGIYKRRNIQFSAVKGLRPTPDRLRETLFNWLMYDIQDACVLDVCAGSGALGFEAISRGAAHCTMLEPNKLQFSMLKAGVATLDCGDKVSLLNLKAEKALPQLTQPYQIVFLDPPYQLNLWQPLLNMLFDHGLLDHALIYMEADREHQTLGLSEEIFNQLTLMKHTKMGQVFAGLYRTEHQL